MSQTRMTKQGAKAAIAAVDKIFEASPRSRRIEMLGELNEAMLFLEECQRTMAEEVSEPEEKK